MNKAARLFLTAKILQVAVVLLAANLWLPLRGAPSISVAVGTVTAFAAIDLIWLKERAK